MDLKQDPKNFRYLLRVLKLENNALNAISTIINIIENIVNFPNEDKYKSIRFNNKTFTENIIKIKGALDLLICLGFIKKIKDHQEFLILQNMNLCILKDHLEELKLLVPSLPKPRQDQSEFTTFSQIKEMKKQKQEYVDLLIRQAEEDRLIKLEKESKNVEKLLKYQREKAKQDKEKMENLRNKLNLIKK